MQQEVEPLLEPGEDETRPERKSTIIWDDEPEDDDVMSTFTSSPPVPDLRKLLAEHVKLVPLLVGLAALFAIAFSPYELHLSGRSIPEAKRCLAILAFVSVLWASEAVPLFVASLAVPFLVVIFRCVLPDPSSPSAPKWGPCTGVDCANCTIPACDALWEPLDARDTALAVTEQFFDPTILLFLAGFSMGAALDKYRLSHRCAALVLTPFGKTPKGVLLGVMLLGFFLSMWISNVPSSVLCTTVVMPMLRLLDSDDPYAKAILLGIAFSNNIGGMSTPIASPQNVVAFQLVQEHGVNFGSWMGFSLPYCAAMLALVWLFLVWKYPSKLQSIDISTSTSRLKLVMSQYVVLSVVVTTILLCACFPKMKHVVGNLGILGLFPVVTFFGTGLLDRADLHGMNWSVILLIGGGLSLGYAMERSLLLQIMAEALKKALGDAGMYAYTIIFAAFMGLIANFVSSTISAIIILPVVNQVGVQIGHPAALVMASVLLASGAMMLPVSSFPNANSYAQTDDKGNAIVSVRDFLAAGVVATAICLVGMASIGVLLAMAFRW